MGSVRDVVVPGPGRKRLLRVNQLHRWWRIVVHPNGTSRGLYPAELRNHPPGNPAVVRVVHGSALVKPCARKKVLFVLPRVELLGRFVQRPGQQRNDVLVVVHAEH